MQQRRVVVLLVGAGLMAASCIPAPPPPPPPDWVPAQVESLVVSPDQLTAGSEFTVSVTATDEHAVTDIDVSFVRPNGVASGQVECQLDGVDPEWNGFELDDPQPIAHVDLDCEMPAALNGGTWTVHATARDAAGFPPPATARGTATLEVVGGSDDYEPPVLESVQVTPVPLVTGSKFTITIRISDDSALDPVPRVPGMGYTGTHDMSYGRPCYEPTLTRLSPTLHEWSFPCQANSDGKFGIYRASFTVYDAVENPLSETVEFEMSPKP